jgi:DNA-binding IclR family transcriptional regulator
MSQQLSLTDTALGEAQLALEESEREVDELRESGRQRTAVLEQTVGELYAVQREVRGRGEERDAQIEALIAEVALVLCFRFVVAIICSSPPN